MHHRIQLTALLLLLLATPAHGKVSRGGQGLPHRFQLPVVQVNGKPYYRTFRVTSAEGYKRIADPKNAFRWFQGSGQYGDGFYLFRTLRDAKRFATSEAERGVKRDTIVEVLLPKERFDQVKKAEVPKALDWKMQGSGPQHEALRTMRLDNHLVFGRWAESPFTSEPFYRRMNGAAQIAVTQRGQPSILNDALLRLYEARRGAN